MTKQKQAITKRASARQASRSGIKGRSMPGYVAPVEVTEDTEPAEVIEPVEEVIEETGE